MSLAISLFPSIFGTILHTPVVINPYHVWDHHVITAKHSISGISEVSLLSPTVCQLLKMQHNQELWLPDGDLVVQVENTFSSRQTFDAPWLMPALHYEISCYPICDILDANTAWNALPRLRLLNQFKFFEWTEGCPYNAMNGARKLLKFVARDGVMNQSAPGLGKGRPNMRTRVVVLASQDLRNILNMIVKRITGQFWPRG